MKKIKIGISSCLLGEEVRFNGGHKQSHICTKELNQYFDYRSVCPEVSIGLGIPRKPIRLIGDPAKPRAVEVRDSSIDVSDRLSEFSEKKAEELDDLCGYIFIKGSPSCGLFRVKVYQDNGYPNNEAGRGIYAKAITDRYPLLPVEEAGRLTDPILKENFITRVFAYHKWQQLQAKGLTIHAILDFHSQYKYTLMAHNHKAYSTLGRVLANAGKHEANALGQQYFSDLMQALEQKATRKTNTNVLMHIQGYLKKYLQTQEKEKLVEVVEQYRLGILPLIVPITLLKHHFNNHPNDYIAKQAFLQPYPDELSLRNQI